MEMYAKYMQALSEAVGFELSLDNGSCLFELDGRNFYLQAAENGSAVRAYLEIGAVSSVRTDAVCRELLKANTLLTGTHGAALSFDEVRGQAALNLDVPLLGLDPEGFVQILENLAAEGRTWSAELERINKEQAELASALQDQILQEAQDAAAGTGSVNNMLMV